MPVTSNYVLSGRFVPALRINQSLTAPGERRILQWLVRFAPRWVTSDGLTLLGLAGQVAAGAFYALSRIHPYSLLGVCVCLVINWLGDSLDGTLARFRAQQRPRYGFYVDHMVDVFGATALMCGLGLSGLLHWQVAVALLITFLILASESYLASYTLSQFELSQGFLGPTEIRILLILGSLVALHSPAFTLWGHRLLLFDAGGLVGALCMTVMAIAVTTRHIAQLYREEPLPTQPQELGSQTQVRR